MTSNAPLVLGCGDEFDNDIEDLIGEECESDFDFDDISFEVEVDGFEDDEVVA